MIAAVPHQTVRCSSQARSAGSYLVIAVLALAYAPILRADDNDVISRNERAVNSLVETLGDDFKKIDWPREAKNIERILERTWSRNGWTDESDKFALELARDVSAIPPWEFMNRMNLASSRLTERYGLSPQDSTRMKALALREVTATLLKNSKVVLKQAAEYMELRRDDKPFTPELIAEWIKESKPLATEFEATVDRFANELQKMAPREKQEVLRADMESFQKRQLFVDEMTSRWERGDWHPADWGLESDPAYLEMANAPGARVARPDRPVRAGSMAQANPTAALPKWLSYDPATWFAYVLEFHRKYKLDPGQFTTARSVHDELLARATDFMKARKVELDLIPIAQRGESERYEPIRSLFTELQDRLNAIPTTAQRAEFGSP